MQIQHIDMSVPVSGDAPDAEEKAPSEVSGESSNEPSRADADLGSLAKELVHAVRQRGGGLSWTERAWTARGRELKREQFAREIKGIVKRLASASASVVKDRSSRAEVRIRIYADALAMINALTLEQDVQMARSRTVRRWGWRVAGVFAVSGASVVAFILYR